MAANFLDGAGLPHREAVRFPEREKVSHPAFSPKLSMCQEARECAETRLPSVTAASYDREGELRMWRLINRRSVWL
jgi:hypothetical protein